MGNMDHVSHESWTTVSTAAGATATAPLHQQPGNFQHGPVSYSPSGQAKNSDTSFDSGKHRFGGLELESNSSSVTDQSWVKRIKWFRNTRTHRDAATPTMFEETPYVGGTMDSAAVPIPVRMKEKIDPKDPKLAPLSAFGRITSWMTANSSHVDEESVLDFQESEWTPPDSSYGAACPLFGWIPKKTRQNIEFTIMLALVVLLVYLVVMLSIMISEARRDDALAEDTGALNLDDDRYIGYNDDKSNSKYDDDPY